MSNDKKESKVVHAFPGTELPENPVQIDKMSDLARYCQHPKIRLNIEERLVYCDVCNSALDPFDFLHHNARTLQRAWESHAMATAAVNAINERVSGLKAEENRLRGRIKRLQEKKSGTVVDVRGKTD